MPPLPAVNVAVVAALMAAFTATAPPAPPLPPMLTLKAKPPVPPLPAVKVMLPVPVMVKPVKVSTAPTVMLPPLPPAASYVTAAPSAVRMTTSPFVDAAATVTLPVLVTVMPPVAPAPVFSSRRFFASVFIATAAVPMPLTAFKDTVFALS